MKIKSTPLKHCFIIEPTIVEDERGYFYEKFNKSDFEKMTGMKGDFVQDNISKSSYGVLRGLHLQKGQHAQAKLVSCIEGKVLDVAVDVRRNSPTFGQWISVELTGDNKTQLYIPRGFAHGFIVLSETAIFAYKCDNFYHKESEGGIIWNDEELKIDWKLPIEDIVLSEKDKAQKSFREGDF